MDVAGADQASALCHASSSNVLKSSLSHRQVPIEYLTASAEDCTAVIYDSNFSRL